MSQFWDPPRDIGSSPWVMFTGSLLWTVFLMLTSSFLCRPVALETSLISTFSFHEGKLGHLLLDLVKENTTFTED